MLPVAKAVGPNRIVPGRSIVCPVGDTGLAAEEEKELRRRLVQQALDSLSTEAV
jgi:glycine reductase